MYEHCREITRLFVNVYFESEYKNDAHHNNLQNSHATIVFENRETKYLICMWWWRPISCLALFQRDRRKKTRIFSLAIYFGIFGSISMITCCLLLSALMFHFRLNKICHANFSAIFLTVSRSMPVFWMCSEHKSFTSQSMFFSCFDTKLNLIEVVVFFGRANKSIWTIQPKFVWLIIIIF